MILTLCYDPGGVGQWRTARPPQRWDSGDRIFFWRSSPALDVVGLGEFRGLSRRVTDAGEAIFRVRYLGPILSRPVTIDELRSGPVVCDASFLKSGPAGTVFPISVAQGERIYAHVCRSNQFVGYVWPDISQSTRDVGLNDIDLFDVAGREGGRKLVHHFRLERDRRVVEAKKRAVLDLCGRLACEVCCFDFREYYGELGDRFCEVHHRKPLSNSEQITNLADLAIVCSNCHRMLHRGERVKSIRSLQKLIASCGLRK